MRSIICVLALLLFSVCGFAQSPRPAHEDICGKLKRAGFIAYGFKDGQRTELGPQPLLLKDVRIKSVVRSIYGNACTILSLQIRPSPSTPENDWAQSLDLLISSDNAPAFDLKRGAKINVFKEGKDLSIYDQD